MVRGILGAVAASKLRVAALGVLLVGGTVGGGFAFGALGAPDVAAVDNRFGGVSAETTTIETDLVVDNPNPVGLGLSDVSVSYAVEMNGVRMASGGREGVEIGTGNTTVPLETQMRNGKLPAWWVTHLRNGEHTELVVHATVTSGTLNESVEAPEVREQIDTDIASSFNSTETLPIEANREPVVDDPVMYVNETRGWWGDVSDEETEIRMQFDVFNPKPYAIPVQEVAYEVRMNGIEMGAGSTDRSYVIPAGGTRTVEATLTLRNDRLDEWWVSHLRRNQVTDLAIDLSMVVDLSNAGGPRTTVPVDTIEHTIDTDIFGNKARYPTGEASAEGASAGGSDTPTPTTTSNGADEDATATATPTVASSPTPTPTPTATDDPFGTPTEPFNGTDG